MKKKHFQIIGVVALVVLVAGFFIAESILDVNRQSALNDAEVLQDTPLNEEPDASESDSTEASEEAPETIFTPQTAAAPYEKGGIMVVNKKHPLPASYNPGEDNEAVSHLKSLIAAAQKAGVDVINSWSGFRSYSTQVGLYNQYVSQSGQAEADTFSARPGYSEHQSGLAFDLKDSSGDLYRIDDKTYNYANDWVAQNAYRFGFVVRYLDEWQSVTGYHGEPWHLRYLGEDVAGKVFSQNVPLETYLSVSGGDYY